MLRHDGVDAVYLSLPNSLHEAWAMKALAAGKHVICEKPLGLSADSVERMIAFADQRGLLLYENIMYLHHPQHRMIREMVERGDIGNLRAFRSSFGFTLTRPGDFRLNGGPGSGTFHDQARYPLSAALYHVRGDLREFSGYALFQRGVNVSLHACGMSTSGESFWCSIGFEQPYECWYELVGERGMIRLERAYTTPADLSATIRITSGAETREVMVPPADHFQLMIEHVAGLIERQQGFDREHAETRRLARAADLLWSGCRQIEAGTDKCVR